MTATAGAAGDDIAGQRSLPEVERSLLQMMSLADWKRFAPETLALTAVIVLAKAWVHQNPAELGDMPNPLWIPVVLISAQYGIMGGLFATLAATVAFFARAWPVQSGMQDFYQFTAAVAAQPCAWFATALVIGGLRSLHLHHELGLADQAAQSRAAAEELAQGLQEAVSEIARLELRIASDVSSCDNLIESLATLEIENPQAMMMSAASFVRDGVGANYVAVYVRGEHGFEPGTALDGSFPIAGPAIPPFIHSVPERDWHQQDPETHHQWRAVWPEHAPKPLGVIVCDRLRGSQSAETAMRRLQQICRILESLASKCNRSDAIP